MLPDPNRPVDESIVRPTVEKDYFAEASADKSILQRWLDFRDDHELLQRAPEKIKDKYEHILRDHFILGEAAKMMLADQTRLSLATSYLRLQQRRLLRAKNEAEWNIQRYLENQDRLTRAAPIERILAEDLPNPGEGENV